MDYRFADGSFRHFAQPPEVLEVAGGRIQFLGFCRPENRGATPLVFVGGAFQSFWSFRPEVRGLLDRHPVLLVDLPGQGQNEQRSAGLSFEDLADVLAGGLDRWGLERIVPIGLSYGAAIAHTFAARHPQRTRQVILGGISPSIRPSLRALLELGFDLIDRGDVESFAEGCAAHLFNPARFPETGVTEDMVERLRAGIATLTPGALQRYEDNTQRLLDARLGPSPACDALVFSARFDGFILPHEAMAVARACPRGRFALFAAGDHLLPLERPAELVALYRAFLSGDPLEGLPGLEMLDPGRPEDLERRVDPRWPADLPALLEHRSGRGTAGRMVNVGAHGCLVIPDRPLRTATDLTTLHVPAAGLVIAVAAAAERHGVRCTFLRTSRAGADAVRRLVAAASPRVRAPQEAVELVVSSEID